MSATDDAAPTQALRVAEAEQGADRLAGDLLDDTPEAARVRETVLERLKKVPDEGWRVAGVSLYIVVAPDTPLGNAGSGPGDADTSAFWAQTRTIGERTLYQVALPAVIPIDARPDTPASEQDLPLGDLPGLLARMFANVYTREPHLRAGGAQYVIAHIRELRAPAAWLALQRRRAEDGDTHWQAIPWEEAKVARVVKVYLRGALDMFDATPIGAPRGYYDHYDAQTRQTGHIAFGRSAAVLGGLSDATLRTFITLLQSGEMAPTGGLTRASLIPTIAQIAQWNGTEDVREIRDQVQEIKRGGDAATTGQIWISWALAVVGVALALISYLKEPLYLAPGLGLQAISSFFFATYARTGRRSILRVGEVIFWLGVILGIAGGILGALKQPIPFLPR